jgi:murein DD-endopeptidase MepM/ murein hydrolase activator NlpD
MMIVGGGALVLGAGALWALRPRTSVPIVPLGRPCLTRWGVMNDQSFYSSAATLMDDALIAQFTQAMAFDFNFAHDLWPGAQFRAVYRKDIRGPTLLIAILTVPAFHDQRRDPAGQVTMDQPAKSRQFYLYEPADDVSPAWFTTDGVSAARGLMRTPLDAAKVSFGFDRLHPILGRINSQKGVNLPCPIGTPVYAAGDGVVIRATEVAHTAADGPVLAIRHNEHLVTRYAQLGRLVDGVGVGTKVAQGQRVAFTGSTGNSTNPHLHFGIIVDGQPVDPLSYDTSPVRTLADGDLSRFRLRRDRLDAVREACA